MTEKRFQLLDTQISEVNMPTALQLSVDRLQAGLGGYVCFCNVHTVVTARRDIALRKAINESFLSLPDGKPLSVVRKWQGNTEVDQVAGPDFFPYFIQHAGPFRHFLMGSTEEALGKLEKNLKERFPQINLVGSYSPPFGPLTNEENKKIQDKIIAAQADVVWVGLGAPKQEYWMATNWQALKPALLFGVGAAFDFHANTVSRAPEWMRKNGLEWFYRLMSEPRRLWRRYFVTNSLFIFYLFKEWLFRRIM